MKRNNQVGKFAGAGCFMILFNTILSFAFIGGLIYFIFWCLQHFGVLAKFGI
jgi:hypothetical protein